MRALVAAVLLACMCGGIAAAAPARDLIHQALTAMGGEARLKAITAIDYVAVGERQMVEQSVRPEGPYWTDHFRVREVRDIAGGRTRIERQDAGYAANMWWLQQTAPTTTTIVIDRPYAATWDGSGFESASATYGDDDADAAAFAPERVLFTVLDDPSAALETRLPNGNDIIDFTVGRTHAQLALDPLSHLPLAVSWTRAYPYSVSLNAWGDVRTTFAYGGWTFEPYGIRYPRQWTFERNALPDTDMQIVALTVNPPLASIALDIPATAKTPPRPVDAIPLGDGGDGPPQTLAPGVTLYPGRWNVAFVKQTDGVVVIEAPISSNYAKAEFAYVRDVLHDRVKAVITTSDSWPHIAGFRQAVAEHIPVYALDKNRAILERLLTAAHALRPDDYRRQPRLPDWHIVAGPTDIGSGSNRLTVLPYRTATGERQMMIWLPETGLLYTSDLFAPNGDDGWFTPEYLKEAMEAVDRYHIAPKSVWGMHYGLTPWASIVEVVTDFVPH